MKKWIHWEFVFGKTLKKDTKISLGEIQSAFQGDQPPIGRSRKLGFQREFYVPVFQRNGDSTCLRPKRTEIPLASSQKELRFHFPASKKNWDSTCPRPKRTSIPLARLQKALKLQLPMSQKAKKVVFNWLNCHVHWYSAKTPQKLFGLLLVFCCFAAPEKKRFSFSYEKLNYFC